MERKRKTKKIVLFIAIVATIFAAFTLTACGESEKENGNGYYDYGEGTKLADVSFPVTIPYVTDFTFDYYDSNGEKIEDKSIVFEPNDEIFVQVSFTLTADAYAAGKSKFTLKIAPSEEFDGRIYSANTSDSSNRELTTTFTADDGNDKKCEVEAKIRFGYNSGRLRFNYRYDNEGFASAAISPLEGSSPLWFAYDKGTNGYIVGRDMTFWWSSDWLEELTEFVVPTEYKGSPITGLGEKFFNDCDLLKKVVLPSTLKTIGNEAFRDCSALESITFPDSVTSIGEKAFYGCTSLRKVTLPDGIEDVGYEAFGECNSLQYNTHRQGMYLGSAKNDYLSLVKFGYGVENPTVHEDCEVIGRYAFNPDQRYEGDLPALKSITLPSKVRVIGDGAFYYCTLLETAILPTSLTRIGNGAFFGCDSLNIATMSNGLKTIGDRAFTYCRSLENVTIPDSVTHVGESAFADCEKLYTEDETGYYIGTKSNKYAVLVKAKPTTDACVKEGCAAIGSGAFSGMETLKAVALPGSVKSIGSEAFSGCESLRDIGMPSVTSIGDFAFNGCTALESITIPDTVTTIGYAVFACSGLKSVSLLNGIVSIGDAAFAGCESLETVVLPDTLTEIGSGAFEGCKSLKTISIPDSVVNIGEQAFKDCVALATVKLSANLESVKERVFDSCSSLTSVTFGGNISRVHEQAFHSVSSLKEITFAGTRKAWLDILSFLAAGSGNFPDITIAHCADGDVVFNIYGEAYGEVLIFLSAPVFVRN